MSLSPENEVVIPKLSDLSDKLVVRIFSFLDKSTLESIMLVNKRYSIKY